MKPIRFPEDELAHDCIIEWWYFNGHLVGDDGNRYSFMDCLFKANVKEVEIPFLSKIPIKTGNGFHKDEGSMKKEGEKITTFILPIYLSTSNGQFDI